MVTPIIADLRKFEEYMQTYIWVISGTSHDPERILGLYEDISERIEELQERDHVLVRENNLVSTAALIKEKIVFPMMSLSRAYEAIQSGRSYTSDWLDKDFARVLACVHLLDEKISHYEAIISKK